MIQVQFFLYYNNSYTYFHTYSFLGSYSVVATNELAQVSQFWKLDVYTKPKVLSKLGPARQVSQAEHVELRLKVESVPPPEVTWWECFFKIELFC